MHIVCERSGGFAGLTTRTEIDSASLTKVQQRELKTLIEQADLLNQRFAKKRKTRNAPNTLADGFQYDLTVTNDDDEFALSLKEESASAEMLALLDWLLKVKREA